MVRLVLTFVLLCIGAVIACAQTTVFAANDPAVFESGFFANGTIDGSASRDFASRNSRMDFAVQGSRLVLRCYATTSGAAEASVNGGAFFTLAAPAGTWSDVVIFTGLADTTHRVTIRRRDSGSFSVSADAMLTVTSSSASLTHISIIDPANWSTVVYPVVTGLLSNPYIASEGRTFVPRTDIDGFAGGLLYATTYSDGSIIFRMRGTKIMAWMYRFSGSWQVTVNGVNQPPIVLPSGGTYAWVTLADGLAPNTVHTVVLTNVRMKTGRYEAIHSLMFPGGELMMDDPAPNRPVLMAYGHSIVSGNKLPDNSGVYYQAMAQVRNYAIASRGIAGSTFKRFPTHTDPRFNQLSGEARMQEIVDVQPAICIIDYFVNDLNNASASRPIETPEDLRDVLIPSLNYLLVACPNTKFYLLGILDKVPFTKDPVDWDAAIVQAVNAVNSPRVSFISQSGTIDPATDTFDGIHPNLEGYQKVAARIEPFIFEGPQAQSFSVDLVQGTSATFALGATNPSNLPLTYTLVGMPANGTITGTAPTYTYVPNVGFFGTDTLTYRATDGRLSGAIATVTFNVARANQAPVAVDDEATTPFETFVDVDVLVNDSDPDADSLVVDNVASPANGTAEILPSGQIRYTPNAGFSGADAFTYTIRDPAGATSSATLRVSVGSAATSVSVANATSLAGQTVNLSARLVRGLSNEPIPGKTLTFSLAGVAVGTAVTGEDGWATLAATAPDAAGSYAIAAIYDGGGADLPSSGSGNLQVDRHGSTLTADSVTFAPASTATLSATLLRSDGVPVEGQTVRFLLNGNEVGTGATDASGRASVPYVVPAGGAAGTHLIEAFFDGSASVEPSSGSGTLTVPGIGVTLTMNNVAGDIGARVTLVSKLTQAGTTTGLAGKTVIFFADGQEVGSAITDATGGALLPFTIPTTWGAGTRPISVQFAGDSSYAAGSSSATLTVRRSESLTTGSNRSGLRGQTVVLIGYLRRRSDRAWLPSRTLSFRVAGVAGVFTATTNSLGRADASFRIPTTLAPGNYTITIDFGGDTDYLPSTGTATLTVNP